MGEVGQAIQRSLHERRCGRYAAGLASLGLHDMGFDLVTFSGGKAIRGPQCAGLLIGRKEMVANALLNNSPHEDTLGRSQKVGKEEIVGMVKALELFLAEDHDALAKEWQARLDVVSREITKVSGVSTSFLCARHRQSRAAHAHYLGRGPHFADSPQQAAKLLRSSKPSIVISSWRGTGQDWR
jgi:cysteine sulfinate desulfinase/cysteine desulfurase-like protein